MIIVVENTETITGEVASNQPTKYVLQNETTAEEIAKNDENRFLAISRIFESYIFFSKFCTNLSASLDIFMNRMKADQARGKPISTDVTVQTLFKSISGTFSKFLKFFKA